MEPVRVKCRCPKCRSRDLIATEETSALMDFDISGGVMTKVEYSEHFSDFIGVTLSCKKCKHMWKPRRVSNVGQLEDRTDG